MSEMVDRVAKAIQDAAHSGRDVSWEHAAIAAIVAMREPTNEMLIAGNEAGLAFETLMDDDRFSCERATYEAMINAAT